MLTHSPNQNQLSLFGTSFKQYLNLKEPSILLADQIRWKDLEKAFAPLYASKGAPVKPIRLIVGLLLLKYLYNLSDEAVVEQWKYNNYFQ